MLDAFLVNPLAGLAMTLTVAALAGASIWRGLRAQRWRTRAPLLIVGVLVGLSAALMGWGAVGNLLEARAQAARHPPPGRLIAVDGYRLHIFCEGPKTPGAPTIVWIPGVRSQGLMLSHLHNALRGEYRSCLYDRSGSGWSDVGRLPKTVERDVAELQATLAGAGERPPYVLAAHSMGGLLATNFAARHRDEMRGMVLVDTMSAQAFLVGRDFYCDQVRTGTRVGALLAQFGLSWPAVKAKPAPRVRVVYDRLGPDVRAAMIANDGLPKSTLMMGEVYAEACRDPIAMVAGDGALGDLPLVVIQPQAQGLFTRVAQAGPHIRSFAGRPLNPFEIENLDRLWRQMEAGNARLSTRGRLIIGPAGTTHELPFERPDVVIAAVRDVIAQGAPPFTAQRTP